jgi:hypothetical protein
VSRSLDLRWKKALYSPRQGLAVAVLLGRSLRGPEPGVSGVSRQGRSLRAGDKLLPKFPPRVSTPISRASDTRRKMTPEAWAGVSGP